MTPARHPQKRSDGRSSISAWHRLSLNAPALPTRTTVALPGGWDARATRRPCQRATKPVQKARRLAKPQSGRCSGLRPIALVFPLFSLFPLFLSPLARPLKTQARRAD